MYSFVFIAPGNLFWKQPFFSGKHSHTKKFNFQQNEKKNDKKGSLICLKKQFGKNGIWISFSPAKPAFAHLFPKI